jgi:hypothetical protein
VCRMGGADRGCRSADMSKSEAWGGVPAWRIKNLRIALIDAEQRGADPADSGADLSHRALRRRFGRGRQALQMIARNFGLFRSLARRSAAQRLRLAQRSRLGLHLPAALCRLRPIVGPASQCAAPHRQTLGCRNPGPGCLCRLDPTDHPHAGATTAGARPQAERTHPAAGPA